MGCVCQTSLCHLILCFVKPTICAPPSDWVSDEPRYGVDTTNDPLHQRNVAFTQACFPFPHGTEPHKRTFHRHLAKLHGATTLQQRHTKPHSYDSYVKAFRSPTCRVYTRTFPMPQWRGGPHTHSPQPILSIGPAR